VRFLPAGPAALLVEVDGPDQARALQAEIARQRAAISRTVDELERDPPHAMLDIGSIAVACALGYLDFRFGGEPWRPGHPFRPKMGRARQVVKEGWKKRQKSPASSGTPVAP